jgi:hypothetical protein
MQLGAQALHDTDDRPGGAHAGSPLCMPRRCCVPMPAHAGRQTFAPRPLPTAARAPLPDPAERCLAWLIHSSTMGSSMPGHV